MQKQRVDQTGLYGWWCHFLVLKGTAGSAMQESSRAAFGAVLWHRNQKGLTWNRVQKPLIVYWIYPGRKMSVPAFLPYTHEITDWIMECCCNNSNICTVLATSFFLHLMPAYLFRSYKGAWKKEVLRFLTSVVEKGTQGKSWYGAWVPVHYIYPIPLKTSIAIHETFLFSMASLPALSQLNSHWNASCDLSDYVSYGRFFDFSLTVVPDALYISDKNPLLSHSIKDFLVNTSK